MINDDGKWVTNIIWKHKERLIDAPWIMAIMIMLTFKNKYTYDEFDTILTKLENGTLTKEEFWKREWIKWNYGLEVNLKNF